MRGEQGGWAGFEEDGFSYIEERASWLIFQG
jgi:hypothetical protein